jgi:hypothetical protein
MESKPTLFPERISDSMLSSLYSCELKWFRTYCQRFSFFESSPDLIAGRIFAKACEITRIEYYFKNTSEEDAIEIGAEYILEAEDTGHRSKTNEVVADRFRKYFKFMKMDGDYTPLQLVDGNFAIEYKFDIELPILNPDTHKPIIYTGKMDGIMAKYHNGVFMGNKIHDEKSTESLSRIAFSKDAENQNGVVDIDKETNKYLMSSQLISYGWAAQCIKIPIVGATIARVPLSSTYEAPIIINIDINPFQIQLWYNGFIARLSELVAKYTVWKSSGSIPHNYFFPSYKNDCESFGRLCNYTIGCRSPQGEELLSNAYQQVIWDSEKKEQIPLVEYLEKINVRY